jgi:hypothetical protein
MLFQDSHYTNRHNICQNNSDMVSDNIILARSGHEIRVTEVG